MDQLRKIQSSQIREIRGLGLMVGIELKSKAMPYIRALQDHKILALNAGLTVIRLLPPLVITTSQLDQVVAAIAEVLALDPSRIGALSSGFHHLDRIGQPLQSIG